MGYSRGDKPLTLMRCQLYEALEGWKSVCGKAYNLKSIKGKIFCSSSFLSFVSLLLSSCHHDMMRADPAVGGGGDSIINKYIIKFVWW